MNSESSRTVILSIASRIWSWVAVAMWWSPFLSGRQVVVLVIAAESVAAWGLLSWRPPRGAPRAVGGPSRGCADWRRGGQPSRPAATGARRRAGRAGPRGWAGRPGAEGPPRRSAGRRGGRREWRRDGSVGPHRRRLWRGPSRRPRRTRWRLGRRADRPVRDGRPAVPRYS